MKRCGLAAVIVWSLACSPSQGQVSAAAPKEAAQAALEAGDAALEANRCDEAIAAYLKASSLDARLWRARLHLIRAYAQSGKTKQRDTLRSEIKRLSASGKYPDLNRLSGYILEKFEVAGRKVSAAEYLRPTGRSNTYYLFSIFGADGNVDSTIALESDNFDQISWSRRHPDLAAKGERLFSLDGDSNNMHTTYKFFDGEPNYDALRSVVVDILTGKTRGLSSTPTGPLLPEPPLQ